MHVLAKVLRRRIQAARTSGDIGPGLTDCAVSYSPLRAANTIAPAEGQQGRDECLPEEMCI